MFEVPFAELVHVHFWALRLTRGNHSLSVLAAHRCECRCSSILLTLLQVPLLLDSCSCLQAIWAQLPLPLQGFPAGFPCFFCLGTTHDRLVQVLV